MKWWSSENQSEAQAQLTLGDGIHITMNDLLACQPLAGLLSLRPDPRLVGRRHGQYLSRMKGRGMEFSEVRAYQQGDDIRAIDWRITARTGKAHTKLYEEERERPVFILLDLSASMRFGSSLYLKSTQACYLAAALAWSSFKGGDRVGMVCLTDHQFSEVPARARRQGLTHVLETIEDSHQHHLAEQGQSPSNRLGQALEHLRRHAHTGAMIAVISDFQSLDAESEQALAMLKRHNQIMTFNIFDPLEQHLAEKFKGDLCVSDGVESGLLNLSNNSVRDDYQQRVMRQQQYCRQVLSQVTRHQYKLSAAISLEQQLQGALL
ncbi:DUF58 domain-containing protein [Echinimonas agarilytica]|uniref:DUF58 domain-containing protein n=1 Tax=Echinimonas agarilytica TaxID=1215918 RepID=A0AA42B7F7_9GAMM|nr:DUF58 domain-containing protein [Echinimonas agarilytica]MCM2679223.1 DUF58 domain-containing protein [Echinimonas agarilytica]